MAWYNFFASKKETPPIEVIKQTAKRAPLRAGYSTGNVYYFPVGFDGEKNLGEMGPILDRKPRYYDLSARSWDAYKTDRLAKIVIDRWTTWIVDTGLNLKCNIQKNTLISEGIQIDKTKTEAFNDTVEPRWNVWSNSKNSSYSGEQTFREITKEVFLNGKIGGDCLVVLRYIDNTVKVQMIDGSRLATPFGYTPETGNIICHGIEMTPTGKHVKYHVRKSGVFTFNEFDQVPAYSKATGLRTAFIYYGSKWRTDDHRGVPVIATVLNSLSKLDRYTEAVIATAEESAKVVYQVVHQQYSDGSNPMAQDFAKAFDAEAGGEIPEDVEGNQFADRVGVTTNKLALNNPKGAKLERLEGNPTIEGFGDFFNAQSMIICASVGIPWHVALSVYDGSYSSSRAATKDWDHSILVERKWFKSGFLQYVYAFWLYTEILKNKVQAEGYLVAKNNGNWMITESYESNDFVGARFPHIDPLKEVQAERAKLGPLGANFPIGTLESATENLEAGDSDNNMEQFADELKIARKLKLNVDQVIETDDPKNTDSNPSE